MDRASLPPIDSDGKGNVPLSLAVLDTIAARVAADVTGILARRFPGVDLTRAIAEVSKGYTRERERLRTSSTGPTALAARLGFYLPRDVVKSAELARQAHAAGVFPAPEAPLRILDLGAGLGTTSLGVARYAALAGLARSFEIVVVDEDARALDVARDVFTAATDLTVRVEVSASDIAAHLAKETRAFDVVVAGLALNELPERGRLAVSESMLARTTPAGLAMIVEPALAETARALTRVRDALVSTGKAHVVFPCTHLRPCPMLEGERDWCHVDLAMDLAPDIAKRAREASLRDERPTFAGLVLARTEVRSIAGMHRVVSAPLGSKGRTELHVCGADGLVRLRQLDRHVKTAPVVLGDLRRGALIGTAGDPLAVTRVVVP